MIPPKLENCLENVTIDARVLPDSYPEPAAVELPGMPRRMRTLVFLLTDCAQLSHVLKSKLFWEDEPETKD